MKRAQMHRYFIASYDANLQNARPYECRTKKATNKDAHHLQTYELPPRSEIGRTPDESKSYRNVLPGKRTDVNNQR